MAKKNFQTFEKRRKEENRRRKQEEKRQRRFNKNKAGKQESDSPVNDSSNSEHTAAPESSETPEADDN